MDVDVQGRAKGELPVRVARGLSTPALAELHAGRERFFGTQRSRSIL